MQRVFGFVDGAYLRTSAKQLAGFEYVDPSALIRLIHSTVGVYDGRMGRTNYYDAEPDEDAGDIEKYWRRIQRQHDTALRFGTVRGKGRREARRQKGVDVLLAVDMVVGAFSGIFEAVVLVTGDSDFIPAIQEVQRRGVVVILGGFSGHVSDDLAGECDRFMNLAEPEYLEKFAGMKVNIQ